MTILRELQHTYELEIIVPAGRENKGEIERIARDQISQRLESMTFKDSIEGQQELTFILENSDLFFIDDQVLFGDRILSVGNQVRFRYGYVDPNEAGNTDNLSPNRLFVLSGIRSISRDAVTAVGISNGQQQLGSKIVQRAFPPQKISTLVNTLLKDEGGFPEAKNRIVQDTKEIREGIIQRGGETNLAFIYRMASEINYYFYVTDEGGSPTAHFHKSGFARSKTETDTTTVDVKPNPQKAATATEGPTGNFARCKGIITYRPPDEVGGGQLGPVLPESEVLNFSIKFEPNARAICTTARGVDVKEGKPVNEKACNKDIKSKSMSYSGVTVALDDASEFQAVADVPFNTADQKPEEAKNQAEAKLEQGQLGTVDINMTILGNPKIFAGDIWTIDGLKKFDGDYLVKEAMHVVSSSGGYLTTINFTSDGVAGSDAKGDRPARDAFPNLVVELNDASGPGNPGQEFQVVDKDKQIAEKLGKPEGS